MRKIDFRNVGNGGHLVFPSLTILAIFGLKSSRCILPSFRSVGLSVQEKKRETDFQDGRHGGHIGFPIVTTFAVFVSSQLAFRFRRRNEKSIEDGRHGGHIGFPIVKILVILTYKSTRCFLLGLESIGLSVQEKKRKIVFQDSF